MLLEICVDCIESALAAQHGGADRIEVCSSLASGGTTPSLGLVQHCVRRCQIPLMVMIRPHDGGFVYGADDLRTMLHDIDALKNVGVQGVVLGALKPDGAVDMPTMERLIQASRPLEITLHRPFDLCPDPMKALDEIIALHVDRLLTSGQQITAEKGVPLIKQLVGHAGDRLTVMAGAGINNSNVRRIAEATQVRELHASASVPRATELASGEVRFGDNSRVTTVKQVRELIQAMS